MPRNRARAGIALSGNEREATRSEAYLYEAADGRGLPLSPFKKIVAPRLIGRIATGERHGRIDPVPYSDFLVCCEEPPIIGFSSYEKVERLCEMI
jgi:hypothetical protein